ncbi:FkbM family methyltransferase [Thermaurantimonas aggregans]|uniref:FkbM family methyltransferase n=1 Tax=Thermaurantimonas aggregans TaxID=2173829 RepID=UPI0023F52C95|nr:FkbM family methyltransferase [Thermaurantimonas aggregans]MCX8148586.1 FkbM family methyltransferase [Thermaurantimonas aggregans]
MKGTIRTKPVQDDAWLFWLMGQFEDIYDIVVNIGLSSLYAKIQNPDKRLLLVDPNREAIALAAKNLIVNGWIGRCQFEYTFVSHQAGKLIPFYTVGAGAAGSMFKGHAQTAAAISSCIQVPTITIDDLYKKYGWLPEFIKVDVEGAEAQVLEGSALVASFQKTWFMVEMHSPPELPMTKNAELVLKWCESVDYQPWYMKDAQKLDSPDMIAHRGKCHLLLIPKGTEYPMELSRIKQGSTI